MHCRQADRQAGRLASESACLPLQRYEKTFIVLSNIFCPLKCFFRLNKSWKIVLSISSMIRLNNQKKLRLIFDHLDEILQKQGFANFFLQDYYIICPKYSLCFSLNGVAIFKNRAEKLGRHVSLILYAVQSLEKFLAFKISEKCNFCRK